MTSFDAYMSYGTFVEMIHEICIPSVRTEKRRTLA